jgi:hypothetical protein
MDFNFGSALNLELYCYCFDRGEVECLEILWEKKSNLILFYLLGGVLNIYLVAMKFND